MGGYGSGRPSGFGCNTVESCRSIDVNRLHREGCLEPGWRGGWHWTRGGEKMASINLRTEADRLCLAFRVRIDGGEWENVEENIDIIRVFCRFGGSRPYFLCPAVLNGIPCGRRVANLHGLGRYFLCRHCYRLAYASQSEGSWDRALRRSNKIRHRLGGEPGSVKTFPERPKGMWRRTYKRLRDKSIDAETLANEAFIAQTKRLLGSLDIPERKRSFWS
jgi:hypothetical protein